MFLIMGVREKLKRKITPPKLQTGNRERMSVFRGSITEYPGVIVDHFTAFNCERGRIFFLSHCHKGMRTMEDPHTSRGREGGGAQWDTTWHLLS